MSYHNILFLLVGVLYVGGLATPAVALPTVKKLGMTNNSNIQSAGNKNQKSSTSTDSSRPASSVRLGIANSKPVTVNKQSSKNTAKSVNGSDAARRLSVGKYIHASGVDSGYIKPLVSSVDIQTQSNEIIDLTDRVVSLEKETDIMAGQIETKQAILTAGDGIMIDDDNTISLSEDITDKMDNVTQQLAKKVDVENLSENYYTKGEVYTKDEVVNAIFNQNETKQYVQQIVGELTDNNTVYDAGTGERVYVSFVDEFSPSIFE